MMLRVIQILVLTCIIHEECTAIKCYQCNSEKDKDCTSDKVHRKYLKSCPEDHSYCRKAVYVYYFMDSRNDLTIRECAKSYNNQSECYRGRYNRDSYQLVCECTDHGCNRSLQQPVPATAAFMSCFLLLIVFYYQSDSIN